jgi:hypothetical protein
MISLLPDDVQGNKKLYTAGHSYEVEYPKCLDNGIAASHKRPLSSTSDSIMTRFLTSHLTLYFKATRSLNLQTSMSRPYHVNIKQVLLIVTTRKSQNMLASVQDT